MCVTAKPFYCRCVLLILCLLRLPGIRQRLWRLTTATWQFWFISTAGTNVTMSGSRWPATSCDHLPMQITRRRKFREQNRQVSAYLLQIDKNAPEFIFAFFPACTLVWKTWKCQVFWHSSGKCWGFYGNSREMSVNCRGKSPLQKSSQSSFFIRIKGLYDFYHSHYSVMLCMALVFMLCSYHYEVIAHMIGCSSTLTLVVQ